ncbi:hypothetical protein ACVXG9_19480, partial [Escherichia coli]
EIFIREQVIQYFSSVCLRSHSTDCCCRTCCKRPLAVSAVLKLMMACQISIHSTFFQCATSQNPWLPFVVFTSQNMQGTLHMPAIGDIWYGYRHRLC